jgi:hypothetical protein
VLATGVEPRRPSIPGIDDARVVGYADAIAGRTPIGEAVAILGAGGIGFDVALYLLERSSRSTLDAQAFARHWGISTDHAAGGGLDARDRSSARPAHRITMLKRSHTPFGHTLGRSTGWVHRAELARNGVKMLKGVEYKRIDTYGCISRSTASTPWCRSIRSSFASARQPQRGARAGARGAWTRPAPDRGRARRPASSMQSARCWKAPSSQRGCKQRSRDLTIRRWTGIQAARCSSGSRRTSNRSCAASTTPCASFSRRSPPADTC